MLRPLIFALPEVLVEAAVNVKLCRLLSAPPAGARELDACKSAPGFVVPMPALPAPVIRMRSGTLLLAPLPPVKNPSAPNVALSCILPIPEMELLLLLCTKAIPATVLTVSLGLVIVMPPKSIFQNVLEATMLACVSLIFSCLLPGVVVPIVTSLFKRIVPVPPGVKVMGEDEPPIV